MNEESKRGHLFALKVFAMAFIFIGVVTLIVFSIPHLSQALLYILMFGVFVMIFGTIYKILYDIGK
jgi:hypothetical protein